MDNVLSFPTKLDKLAEKIKHDINVRGASQEAWVAATLDLCLDLAEARAEFSANSDFGRWLKANGIELNDHDRAAAIAMGQDPKRAAEVLAVTERRSLQLIHQHEFQPRLASASKTPGPATKPRKESDERAKAFAAYDAIKASGDPLTYDTVRKAAGVGHTAVRAVFTIRQAEAGVTENLDHPEVSTLRDEARKIVRPLIEAGQPVSLATCREKHGLTERTVREAIIAERARLEALQEAAQAAPAPIDMSILSASQQAKFEALERRLRAQLAAGFDAAVAAKVQQWREEVGLDAHCREMDELKTMLSNPRFSVMRKAEYNTILMCLHPDRLRGVTEAQLADAFRIFTHYKLKMINDEEERAEARRKLRSGLPETVADLLARKTNGKKSKP